MDKVFLFNTNTMNCEENLHITHYNPRGLEIKVNYYKDFTNLVEGNGVYPSYIDGVMLDNKPFRIFPYMSQFFLEVEKRLVDKVRVDGIDVLYYNNVPETYFKYVYQLLNNYEAAL